MEIDKKEEALRVYLESISPENNYKPISLENLCIELAKIGIKTSSSALQRWSVAGDWKSKAKSVAIKLASSSTAKNITNDKKVIDAISNIEKSVATSSAIVLEYLEEIKGKPSKTIKEVELVLKIMTASAMLVNKPIEREEGDGKFSTQNLISQLGHIKQEDIIDVEQED